ncbi:transposase (plasmid) [Tundrisphaera lichenicola]|uniref:transposase n=1 Tax=Tundrisphaera lichenicola TaxID=2029860 RepID=UPI003EB69D48
MVRRAGGPRLRRKKGAIERLYTEPPEGSVVLCLDEMGPTVPKTFPGQEPIRADPGIGPDGTARPPGGPGRRSRPAPGGYVFGAFRPATGEAFTACYEHRRSADWVDFLEQVEAWVPAGVSRVYAVFDNLVTHRTTDVLLFALWHERWEFVFQPTYAAYLNLIEPWWKVLKSLALKGRRFRTWEEVTRAVEEATGDWNGHRHQFIWGRRRRHRPKRGPGIAAAPGVR